MTADEYQQLALRTEFTPGFVAEDYSENDVNDRQLARLIHALMGINTESGELTDMVKKHLMYGKDFDPINVIEECGDLMWYIALALDATGYKLSDCMERNIRKLQARYPDKFNSKDALVRNLSAEREALK